ncbi:DUF6597 domain-containing transcriptional factor [Variovorax sp. GT1P44]|uniref:DUF6597 domain-containing transcriptional factor n=1 Tax=Variovorax sp. GT1P44 TaxID=3443742 RepID=UPI003F470670
MVDQVGDGLSHASMLVDRIGRATDNARMLLTRAPGPSLRPFVRTLWAADPGPRDPPAGRTPAREHVLPTGDMHLVFRLSGPPLRLFAGAADSVGYTVGYAIVGGARSAFYARDVSVATRSVGVQLRPGAARALFGMPAHELANRHTPLDQLWGAQAFEALEQLHDAGTPTAQLACLEALLKKRLERRPQAMHAAFQSRLSRDHRHDAGDLSQGRARFAESRAYRRPVVNQPAFCSVARRPEARPRVPRSPGQIRSIRPARRGSESRDRFTRTLR